MSNQSLSARIRERSPGLYPIVIALVAGLLLAGMTFRLSVDPPSTLSAGAGIAVGPTGGRTAAADNAAAAAGGPTAAGGTATPVAGGGGAGSNGADPLGATGAV